MADWQVEFQPEQVTDMPGSSVSPVSPVSLVSPVSPALPLLSADWKLNMSFVSQGWASIQSRLGVGPNARRSFDFMQKKWWNSHAASLATVLCWYENTTLHYSCLHFTRVADRLTPNSCSYRPFFFSFSKRGEFWYFCNIWSSCSPSSQKDKMSL